MLALTILGLAGCAMALVALALDWRASRWPRTYTVEFGDPLPPGFVDTWTPKRPVITRDDR